MSAKRHTVARDDDAGNDLHTITGLGDKTAKALPKLGISSCAELARYLAQHTAKDLSESLAEQDVTIGAKKIENENWLEHARNQAGLANREPANPERDAAAAEEGERVSNDSSKPLDDEVHFSVIFKRHQDDWRVTTYDPRHNGLEKEWKAEPTEWANWILQQMRSLLGPEHASPTVEEGAPPGIEVEILDVQPSEAERSKKLAVQIRFELSGSEKETITAARSPFWIQVQTLDLVTKSPNLVASLPRRLEPETFRYKEKLLFPTPAVGHYELHILVLLLPPVGRMALHKEFALRVKP